MFVLGFKMLVYSNKFVNKSKVIEKKGGKDSHLRASKYKLENHEV